MSCNHEYGQEQGGCYICIAEDNRNYEIRQQNQEQERLREQRLARERSEPPPSYDPGPPAAGYLDGAQILRVFEQEASRGTGPGWQEFGPFHGAHVDHTKVYASKKHGLVIHFWACGRIMYVAVPDEEPQGSYSGYERLWYHLSEQHKHVYLDLHDHDKGVIKKLVPVFDSSWDCCHGHLREEKGFVPGPWWNHLRDVVIPEWVAHVDEVLDAQARQKRDRQRSEQAAHQRDLRSWRPPA